MVLSESTFILSSLRGCYSRLDLLNTFTKGKRGQQVAIMSCDVEAGLLPFIHQYIVGAGLTSHRG